MRTYRRSHKKKAPEDLLRPIPPETRFWERTYKTHNCWFWIGYVAPDGYGRIGLNPRIGKSYMTAHRFSWRLHNGEISNALHVCHTCDTPTCVRPDHLFLGTQADNSADMAAKGHGSGNRARGSSVGISRLTEKDIPIIRELKSHGSLIKDIACRFSVDPSTISVVLSGRTWKHVSNPTLAPVIS